MLGKIEGRRRRGQQRMRWLDGITDSMDMGLSKLRAWWWTVRPGVLQSMGSQSWTWLSDWTELNTVKNFSLVNEAEVYVFLELSCFSYDPTDVGNFISGSSAFSETSLNIWKFMVHILLKPDLENFEHYLSSIFLTQVTMMIMALGDYSPRARHPGVWSQVGLWKHHYEQS